jgi:superkiller protein 3
VTSQNHVAYNNIGSLLLDRGQIDDALFHHEQALAIRSEHRRPGYDALLALYHNNVASDLRRKGRPDEAIIHCQEAIQAQPDYANAYANLGGALIEQGKINEAVPILQKAVELQPDDANLRNAVAGAFRRMGLEEVAITHYEEALRIDSHSIAALNNLAWLLATSAYDSNRNGPRAVTLAAQAVRLSGGTNPLLLHKLAAAYAESGNFPEAVETAEHALQLARDQSNSPLASELEQNIALYRTNSPVRDTRSNNASPSP